MSGQQTVAREPWTVASECREVIANLRELRRKMVRPGSIKSDQEWEIDDILSKAAETIEGLLADRDGTHRDLVRDISWRGDIGKLESRRDQMRLLLIQCFERPINYGRMQKHCRDALKDINCCLDAARKGMLAPVPAPALALGGESAA